MTRHPSRSVPTAVAQISARSEPPTAGCGRVKEPLRRSIPVAELHTQRRFDLRMGAIKQRWTSEEEAALRAGIARHGVGKWRTILKDPEFSSTLSYRSNIDLKDKWRNMDEIMITSSSHDKAKTGVKRARTTPKNNEQIGDEIVDEKPIAPLPSEAKNISNSKKSHSRKVDNFDDKAKTGVKIARTTPKNNKEIDHQMGAIKQRWTSEEEAALRDGIARHGVGKWRTILKDPEFTYTLSHRSNIDLKDKWRNMDEVISTPSSHDKAKTGVKRARTTTKKNEQIDDEIVDEKSIAPLPSEAKNTSNSKKSHSRKVDNFDDKAKTRVRRARTTPKNNEQIDDDIVDEKPIATLPSEAKNTSNSKKYPSRSRSSLNQSEALSIEHSPHIEQPAKGNKKAKPTRKKQGLGGKNVRTTNVPLDSPAMGTRSKKTQPRSLAMSTRSKRRLSF